MTATPEGTAGRGTAPEGRDGDQQRGAVLARSRRRASALTEVAPRRGPLDPSPRPRGLDRLPAPPPPRGRAARVAHVYDIDLDAEDEPSPLPTTPRHRA